MDAKGATAGIREGLRRWLARRTTPSDDPWAGMSKVATGLLLVPSAVSHLARPSDKWWLHVLPPLVALMIGEGVAEVASRRWPCAGALVYAAISRVRLVVIVASVAFLGLMLTGTIPT